jgi:hypothetical protein
MVSSITVLSLDIVRFSQFLSYLSRTPIGNTMTDTKLSILDKINRKINYLLTKKRYEDRLFKLFPRREIEPIIHLNREILIAVLDKSRYITLVVTLTTQGSMYTSSL